MIIIINTNRRWLKSISIINAFLNIIVLHLILGESVAPVSHHQSERLKTAGLLAANRQGAAAF